MGATVITALFVVLIYAIDGAVMTGGVFGIGYAFGVQYTATRLMVALLSGAGIGGTLAAFAAVVNPRVNSEDTGKIIAAFVVLIAVLAAVAYFGLPR